jgi:hypothetical protein
MWFHRTVVPLTINRTSTSKGYSCMKATFLFSVLATTCDYAIELLFCVGTRAATGSLLPSYNSPSRVLHHIDDPFGKGCLPGEVKQSLCAYSSKLPAICGQC